MYQHGWYAAVAFRQLIDNNRTYSCELKGLYSTARGGKARRRQYYMLCMLLDPCISANKSHILIYQRLYKYHHPIYGFKFL